MADETQDEKVARIAREVASQRQAFDAAQPGDTFVLKVSPTNEVTWHVKQGEPHEAATQTVQPPSIVDIRKMEAPHRLRMILCMAVMALVFLGLTFSGEDSFHPFGGMLAFLGFAIYTFMLLGDGVVQHVGFKCPHCGRQLNTAQPWMCGYCDHKNIPGRFTGKPSMLTGCGNTSELCDNKPKAYQCDDCDEIIFFDEDRDGRHRATAVGKPRPPIVKGRPAPNIEVPATIDPLDERIQAAERRKEAFEKEIRAVKAEKGVAMTANELEAERIELEKLTSGEFGKRMNDVERFSLGDDEIIRAGATEEQKISDNPDVPASIKKIRIDRLRRYVMAKLSERKPR